MAKLRPKDFPEEGAIPENQEELEAMVWILMEEMEEMGIPNEFIYSAVMSGVFKWWIDRTGSSWSSFAVMVEALGQMVRHGPAFESLKHGGVQ